MPHADLKYSDDLHIDAPKLLAQVEQIIQTHDAGSGACKGRAYPTAQYHHSHCLLSVSMLTKPHRDAAFTHKLLADLEAALRAALPKTCYFSVGIDYSNPYYVTGTHQM
jgi:hypothetical protein